ncbi:hypothetical protein ABH940_002282 [Streptacidiphilus sp. BW17]
MTVRPSDPQDQPHWPSGPTLLVITASMLAFVLALLIPILGTPLVAATGVAVAARKRD